MINVPKVYITSIPYNFRSYYLWLLFGLYELNKRGEIKLSFRKMTFEDRLIHKSESFREHDKKFRHFLIYKKSRHILTLHIVYKDLSSTIIAKLNSAMI